MVAEQRGVWHAPDSGETLGEQTVASVFVVDGQRVVKFARYDTLQAALTAASLDRSDEVQQAGESLRRFLQRANVLVVPAGGLKDRG